MEQGVRPLSKVAKGKLIKRHTEDLVEGTNVKKLKSSDAGLKRSKSAPRERIPGGVFDGIHAFFIPRGVSKKRLQVWESRFAGLGGVVLGSAMASHKKCDVLHVLAADEAVLSKEVDLLKLRDCKKLRFVQYGWIEDCLKDGQLLSCDAYILLQTQEDTGTTGKTTTQSTPKTQPNLFVTEAKTAIEGAMVVEDETRVDLQGSAKEANVASEVISAEVETEQELDVDEAPDYNKHIAGPLKEMSTIYSDFFGDEWRALTYRKVANKIDKLSYKISVAEELKSVQGIGKSMISKVQEILCTGRLQKLVNLQADPQVQTIQEFASVWGIGPKHARRLYQNGCRSLEDIRQDPSLPSMARIGLKYHLDIILRIPRVEVRQAGAFVQDVLEDLSPGAWLTVGGSYRRGHSTCGDIDLLITHPDGQSHAGLMIRLLEKLRHMEFLSECPISTIQGSIHKVDTFMGICRLPQYPHHRRIDIKVYPKDIYAFALVYFTGNDVLNRRIRYFARTKGYKLSDQGLFKRVVCGTEDMACEVSIPCQSEEDIFKELGLPYPEPQDRNW